MLKRSILIFKTATNNTYLTSHFSLEIYLYYPLLHTGK